MPPKAHSEAILYPNAAEGVLSPKANSEVALKEEEER
jgi:hypothetical protein